MWLCKPNFCVTTLMIVGKLVEYISNRMTSKLVVYLSLVFDFRISNVILTLDQTNL